LSSYLSPRKRLGSSLRARTDHALGFFFVDDVASSHAANRLENGESLLLSGISSISNGFKNNRLGKSNKL
jgi:hypothetical protein